MILNESPIKTTNNFKVNNLKIDLEIPTNLNFKKYIINNNKCIINDNIINSFSSRIGLKFDKAYNLDIIVPSNISDIVEFTYNFSNSDTLIDNINIIFEEYSNADITFKYISDVNGKHFHHLKMNIIMKDNSNGNISIINLMNDNSKSLIAIENETNKNSILNTNLIDIGGNVKINNIIANTKENSINNLNNIYIGTNNDIVDMNYYYINEENNSNNNIEVQGILTGNSKKTFRGIIDFKKHSSESVGKENENCVLLSNTCISRSVPMLLCGEENVIGAHSVSSGQIDENKIFYLMSRGISKDEAKKLIIYSNLDKTLNNINEELKRQIVDNINKKIAI